VFSYFLFVNLILIMNLKNSDCELNFFYIVYRKKLYFLKKQKQVKPQQGDSSSIFGNSRFGSSGGNSGFGSTAGMSEGDGTFSLGTGKSSSGRRVIRTRRNTGGRSTFI